MKTIKFTVAAIIMAAFLAIFLFSCSKDNSASVDVPAGYQKVSVYLTDDPAVFDHVYIDIQSVKALVDTCESSDSNDCDDHHGGGHHGDDDHDSSNNNCRILVDLNVQPGIYDLLTLRNGLDTLLASATIPDGRIIKLQINLGPNNSLVKDSITYPLHLLPGQNSINIQFGGHDWDHYRPGHRRIWLDFDIGRSIIVRNGQFYLRPVFRPFVLRNTAAIEGRVLPREALSVITVFNATDTSYALPNPGGEFKVRGLNPGTYDVFVNASNGYADTTVSGITVAVGRVTHLNTITLHR